MDRPGEVAVGVAGPEVERRHRPHRQDDERHHHPLERRQDRPWLAHPPTSSPGGSGSPSRAAARTRALVSSNDPAMVILSRSKWGSLTVGAEITRPSTTMAKC